MNDLISRQHLITLLETEKEYRSNRGEIGAEKGLCYALEIVDDMPSAQPEQQWIPCSERLPGREWVLCKCRANIHEVLSLRDGYWYHDPQHHYMSGFVTHWMPLPEPPKGEEK